MRSTFGDAFPRDVLYSTEFGDDTLGLLILEECDEFFELSYSTNEVCAVVTPRRHHVCPERGSRQLLHRRLQRHRRNHEAGQRRRLHAWDSSNVGCDDRQVRVALTST